MKDEKVFTADNLPSDAEVFTGQSLPYDPIDDSETYTVQVLKADLKTNPFYKPDDPDPKKRGSKYNISFEFAILDDGEFYGRRLWANTSLALKPTTQKGVPTILYKVISKAIKKELSWDDCGAFAPDIAGLYKHLQEEVVGKQLKVAIENIVNPDTQKTRAKITSYSQVKTELPEFDTEKSKALGEVKKAEAIEKLKNQKKEEVVEDDSIPF